MLKELITPESLKKAFTKNNYRFFEKDEKNYNLNLIGVRSKDLTPNVFNDFVCLLWKFQGVWNLKKYKATTDPGLYYLMNPINVEGTAIMVPGQYSSVYKIGRHKDYEALEQIKPMKYYRDNDKDKEFDMNSKTIVEEIAKTNIHRASSTGTSSVVDKWSAGCMVIADNKDFEELIQICKKSSETFGNNFTFTLIEEKNLI